MNRTRKKTGRACLSLLVIVMLMSVLCPAALADTDGTEPQLTQQPDQLILQLGTRWAGVEFELRTDAGVFPAPIVVDSSGVPVSYTHLDVYKRQAHSCTGISALGHSCVKSA